MTKNVKGMTICVKGLWVLGCAWGGRLVGRKGIMQ